MTYALDPGAVVALLSGAALALLGLAVLPIRPWRPAGLAFALFALLWGAEVVAANLLNAATDPATFRLWVYLHMAAALVLHVPLLFFVLAHPRPAGLLGRAPLGPLLLALPAAVLLLLLASAPQLFVARIGPAAPGGSLFSRGPLYDPVLLVEGILVFALAAAVAARRLFQAPSVDHRNQLALLVAAFVGFLAYRVASHVGYMVLRGPSLVERDGTVLYAFRIAVVAAAVAVCAYGLAGIARRRDLPWRGLIVASATAAFLMGALEGLLRWQGVQGFSAAGLWRLYMVGLFAYALARHRLFDLELRLHHAAPALAYAAAALAGTALLWTLAGDALSRAPLWGLAASAGVVVASAPVARLGRRVADRAAGHVVEPDYLYKRKLDVYRAALEEGEALHATDPTETRFLTDLRRRLGITPQEHRVLLLMLRGEVRYGKPAAAAGGKTRFRIERELGSGSFGRALLAHDPVLDRRVVLKQPWAPWSVDPGGRERFLREARLAARIHHPNVVTVFEVLPDEDPPMLVMEYVPGGSLEDALRGGRRLEPGRAVEVVLGVLAGIERVHKAGIVHRDLKPANILLDEHGTAKVTDFGIAHPPAGARAAATVATAAGQPGSLAYMSPEQARGDAVDARSDLYAVGAILYRCLTGGHYLDLQRATEFEARRRIQEDAPRLPAAGVPSPLEPILGRALAKDRAGRYADAAAMASALAAEWGGAEPPPDRGRPARIPARSLPRAAAPGRA